MSDILLDVKNLNIVYSTSDGGLRTERCKPAD